MGRIRDLILTLLRGQKDHLLKKDSELQNWRSINQFMIFASFLFMAVITAIFSLILTRKIASIFDEVVSERINRINELNIAKNKLQESESKFKAMAETIPNMVWSADARGVVDYHNRAWYEHTGMTIGSVDPQEWNLIVHPLDKEKVEAAWMNSIEKSRKFEIEFRLKDIASGEFRWASGRAAPIFDENHKVKAWVGSATDIHEKKLALLPLSNFSEKKRSLNFEN